jgi:hypothetical protein
MHGPTCVCWADLTPCARVQICDEWLSLVEGSAQVGHCPIVTLEYSSTALYQVSYHV